MLWLLECEIDSIMLLEIFTCIFGINLLLSSNLTGIKTYGYIYNCTTFKLQVKQSYYA